MNAIEKNPYVIAALRLAETSAIVTVLAFLGTLQTALSSANGLASYDWRSALAALGLGLASGIINGAITFLNLTLQAQKAGKA